MPKHVSVNSDKFYVVDQSEHFVHIFDTSPFTDVTPSSATVTYVSNFDFHSAPDTFGYVVNDGLIDSNVGTGPPGSTGMFKKAAVVPREVSP